MSISEKVRKELAETLMRDPSNQLRYLMKTESVLHGALMKDPNNRDLAEARQIASDAIDAFDPAIHEEQLRSREANR